MWEKKSMASSVYLKETGSFKENSQMAVATLILFLGV
jgi:hypothetical protein